MSIFTSIEEHDKEFEYKIMRERFISCGGADRKGNWTIVEIRPRAGYEKEYEDQKLISFEYLMCLFQSKWRGCKKVPEEMLEEVVKRELQEHNINTIIYPMRLTDADGNCIGYKDVPFYAIPTVMIEYIGNELIEWVVRAVNLDFQKN